MDRRIVESREVQILSTGVRLEGIVSIPEDVQGFVTFVHGSGSNRHSPRNHYVADVLQQAGLATLLFDLLTDYEGEIDLRTRRLRFDIELLARRTAGVIEWLDLQPYTYGLKRGLFGSSTGAAAALIAAADIPEKVDAVVSRGGRPDLAGAALREVEAPTLLIVGSHDEEVIDLNEQALAEMSSEVETKLTLISGASHLFEEPGTLDEAARLTGDWFQVHLSSVGIRSVSD